MRVNTAPTPNPSPNLRGGEYSSPLAQGWERGVRGERATVALYLYLFSPRPVTFLPHSSAIMGTDPQNPLQEVFP
jgi:hypothetical protein